MKKLLIALISIMMIVSGCGTSDLEDYKAALLATESFQSGTSESKLSIDLTFDETDMTFEEKRDMSYYERIQVETNMAYDYREVSKAIIDGYFNFGGLGFDMNYYINEDEVLIKLPILDKFLDIDAMVIEDSEDNTVNEDQERAIKKVIDTWNEVLGDEDVFSGSKAYVMTDKGQIKTTTYTINISEAQFDLLKEAFLKILDDEKIVETFLSGSEQFANIEGNQDEFTDYIRSLLKEIRLVEFSGKAYVDFDGRLVRQVLIADLINDGTEPGEVQTMHIEYETTYDQIGDDVELIMPIVNEEDILKLDDDGNIQDYFPDGLF